MHTFCTNIYLCIYTYTYIYIYTVYLYRLYINRNICVSLYSFFLQTNETKHSPVSNAVLFLFTLFIYIRYHSMHIIIYFILQQSLKM